MPDDREDRIRARAHSIWEAEGRPHGRHDDHWDRAAREHDTEAGGDPSARSLGSAAQSDLIPDDAGQGSDRAGSLVDTGPAIGLVAGGVQGGLSGLGGLSLGQEVGHGGEPGSGEPGGMSSIGSGVEEAPGAAPGGPATGVRPAGKGR